MMIKRTFAAGIAALLFSAVAPAEILQLPGGGHSVTQVADSPQRGDTEEDVLEHFGEPQARQAPVGTPAISRWQYTSFQVYFENGIVIHAVHKSLPGG